MDDTLVPDVEPCELQTDVIGTITHASLSAADLFNVAAPRLRGRALTLFFRSERRQVSRALDHAGRGHAEQLHAILHPRERRAVMVRVAADPIVPIGRSIRWTITRIPTVPEHDLF